MEILVESSQYFFLKRLNAKLGNVERIGKGHNSLNV